jgi:hypothetical protein
MVHVLSRAVLIGSARDTAAPEVPRRTHAELARKPFL